MTTLEDMKKQIDEMSANLDRQREELKLKANLFNMEAKDQWDSMEKKYNEFKSNMPKIKQAASDSSDNIQVAMKNLNDEIKSGYQKIKDSL